MFADAHLHSNPVKGIGARKIAENFKKNDGWFIALVMLPTWDYGEQATSLEDFDKAVKKHLKECREAEDKGLKVACFAGLHPAELDKLANKGMSAYEIKDYALNVIDYLFTLCKEQQIDGIGEIGRQHYKVRPDILVITQQLLEYVFKRQREYDCPIQLHLENIRGFTAKNISDMIDAYGSNRDRILIHHAKPGVLDEAIENKVWATTPGIYESLKVAFNRVSTIDFMIESDFIDDPKRPGKVLYPWDIPVALKRLLAEGLIDNDVIERVNIDNITRFFKVDY